MKWPCTLFLIRHDMSAYNIGKLRKEKDPLYQQFLAAWKINPQSKKTKALALEVNEKFALGVSDHNTPLAEVDGTYAELTGRALRAEYKLPHVIHVSPYIRTIRTLELLTKGWPELASVKTYEEERIREQDHGLVGLYNDWKVFCVLHPEQLQLYNLDPYGYKYPQGENVPDVRERNRSWLNTLTREFSGQRVMAITHHLNILAVRANLERWNKDKFMKVDKEDKPVNCGVTIYRGDPVRGKDGKLVLQTYNKQYY